MADKQMFKALVMVELHDSEEEEETKGRGMTRSWLKKREELGYFTNIVRELQFEDTEGFQTFQRNFKPHCARYYIFFSKMLVQHVGCARKRIQHHPT